MSVSETAEEFLLKLLKGKKKLSQGSYFVKVIGN